jgi:hypothetical protein
MRDLFDRYQHAVLAEVIAPGSEDALRRAHRRHRRRGAATSTVAAVVVGVAGTVYFGSGKPSTAPVAISPSPSLSPSAAPSASASALPTSTPITSPQTKSTTKPPAPPPLPPVDLVLVGVPSTVTLQWTEGRYFAEFTITARNVGSVAYDAGVIRVGMPIGASYRWDASVISCRGNDCDVSALTPGVGERSYKITIYTTDIPQQPGGASLGTGSLQLVALDQHNYGDTEYSDATPANNRRTFTLNLAPA